MDNNLQKGKYKFAIPVTWLMSDLVEGTEYFASKFKKE